MTINQLKKILDEAIKDGKSDYKVVVLNELNMNWEDLSVSQIEFYDEARECLLGELRDC